jgi:hypothetical protein
MEKTYVIAGAGFRGFCDALELLKIPGAKVHIIEPAPFFGGIAYSREVKGFCVDKGVHVFDSIPKALADIVSEIMDGKVRSIDYVSQSAFNGTVTAGFSLPDLASLDEGSKAKIALELIALAAAQPAASAPGNLREVLTSRYGETAGGVFAAIFAKVYGVEAREIEPHGLAQTSMGRLKFLGDEEMRVLKAHPWLDTVLAARRKSMGKIDDLVSVYPDDGRAMRGWCDRAAEWLRKKGVEVSLGEKILAMEDGPRGITVKTDKRSLQADKVVWANDNVAALSAAFGSEDSIQKFQSATPMVFATLFTKAEWIADFTYLQNFDPEGYTYRTAAAGMFSNQVRPDGTTFLTCECPVRAGSDRWEKAETLAPAIWDEIKSFRLVKPEARLLDQDIARFPVTFKLPKLGFTACVERFNREIAKRSRRVVLRNVIPFFRRDVYLDSLTVRGLVE